MQLKKVKDHSGLARDMQTGAIMNINKDDIAAARKRKLERRKKEQEFEDLKNEVSDIKIMLTKIIEKLDG
tara:strand:- start:126 stop:335 length:210 start_codon:yes stop_codon:yes gene_type:complete